ncbi:uncharacterized protein MONBRDRAFT_323, partial [Monosiga brevicollis MX1]
LKGYQLKGLRWLANLYEQGINGILADEMGLGKTIQSISTLAHLAEHEGIWGPFLVVTPASTLHNWCEEVSRFTPELKALTAGIGSGAPVANCMAWQVTSYEIVVKDAKYFNRVHWQYMILDEAQAIKSSTSQRWNTLLKFNCRNRLLLTGTPIQNTMAELWALLHFIMPTLFDSHDEFNEWFSKDIESHAQNSSSKLDEKQLQRLHMILQPFMLRRIKRNVENELPDKVEVMIKCPLSARQSRIYRRLKSNIKRDQLSAITSAAMAPVSRSSRAEDKALSSLLNMVMQFRKICNHPNLIARRPVRSPVTHAQLFVADCAKLQVLDDMLRRLKAGGHRVLIYSQMTKMIDLLEEFLTHRQYKYVRLDGSSKISERRDMVADFQSRDDIFAFILSTRAGGIGINLTAADTVIFYDSDWNPTVDQQAMDRAHRLGQTRTVTVYRLITRNSVEERILARAQEKSKVHQMVIQGG